jgi:hypothetical protein
VRRFGDATPLIEGVYHVGPQLFRFDLTRYARTGVGLTSDDLGVSVVYGAFYVAALLTFASLRLERRDLL